MAVKIRLQRQGRHELPFYRIVAADHKYARNGRYLEQVGTYNPANGVDKGAVINEEIAIKWLNTGAQYSDTIKAIFKAKGIFEKANKAQVTVKKAKVAKTKSPAAKSTKKAAAKTTTTKKAAPKKTAAKKTTTAKEGK